MSYERNGWRPNVTPEFLKSFEPVETKSYSGSMPSRIKPVIPKVEQPLIGVHPLEILQSRLHQAIGHPNPEVAKSATELVRELNEKILADEAEPKKVWNYADKEWRWKQNPFHILEWEQTGKKRAETTAALLSRIQIGEPGTLVAEALPEEAILETLGDMDPGSVVDWSVTGSLRLGVSVERSKRSFTTSFLWRLG